MRTLLAWIFLFGLLIFLPAFGFAMDQYEYNLEMQRMQLEQARIQAQGMAMMGAGAAFANGMQQAFRPLPMPVMPVISAPPTYMFNPPSGPPRTCVFTNPGAMQSAYCY